MISKQYLPLYEWCRTRLRQPRPARSLFVGVNGPQGCGKSTVTRQLCQFFQSEGQSAATVSIDDFYLTRAEQVRLASENPGNRFWQSRGYPGTHDIALGERTLEALRSGSGSVAVPVYEKSRFDGKGDRLPASEWKQVPLPVDILFVEGWMLGFRTVGEPVIQDPSLVSINRSLADYWRWWSKLDVLIQLTPRDYRYVVDWRVEAETRMKASGKPGMTDSEARTYVESFLPAYELYLPTVTADLVVVIGKDRLPATSLIKR